MAKSRTSRNILVLSISFCHKHRWKKTHSHQGLRAANDTDGNLYNIILRVTENFKSEKPKIYFIHNEVIIFQARRSLVQKMARHQQPQIEIFFLNISVRRSHIVTDSLKEISQKQKDLKKKLKVLHVWQIY